MARFAVLTLCVIAAISGARGQQSMTPNQYGMTMATRAYEAVCWYEALKVFPDTKSKEYNHCGGPAGAQSIQDQIEHPSEQNRQYMEAYPDAAKTMYGSFMADMNIMGNLPSASFYKAKCERLLKEPDAQPRSDESAALNDRYRGSYPYKAFANCMMSTLRDRHGAGALQAVMDERTVTIWDWKKTLLDRDNEFRKRHGAPPLKLMKDLDDAAQQWADSNSMECNSHHSTPESRYWRGEQVGESIASGGGDDNAAVNAYRASDGWYQEISNYPYPDGYQGDGHDGLFGSIGHFTQTVWNETQYVGYGYAYRCKNFFIVGRYYPAGNLPGAFTKNVAPPLF